MNDDSHKPVQLYLKDLENPKQIGKEWLCTCPCCHTRHLYVHIEKGYFHCWYPGCECHGILEDKKDRKQKPAPPSSALYGRTEAPTHTRRADGCEWTQGGYNDTPTAEWQTLNDENE